MATTNPYDTGNYITFPAGTPSSVVSAYYNALIQNQRMAAQQDPWYVQSLNSLVGNVFNPYINQVIGQQYWEDKETYKTDEQIRQEQARQEALLGTSKAESDYKYQLEQQRQKDIGQALGTWGDFSSQMTPGTPSSWETGGGVAPYGPYSDPWSTSPGPQFQTVSGTPTSQMMNTPGEPGGAVAEPQIETGFKPIEPKTTEGSEFFTTGAPSKVSSIEAIRQMAAKYPEQAGTLATYLKENNLFNLIDPLGKREVDIKGKEADINYKNAQATEKLGTLEGKIRELESKSALNQARAGRETANVDLLVARATSIQDINQIRKYVIDEYMAGRMVDDQFQHYMSLIDGKQLQQTPEQKQTIADTNAKSRVDAAKVMAERDTDAENRKRYTELAAREGLAENGMGAPLTPGEVKEKAALEKLYGKTGGTSKLQQIMEFLGGQKSGVQTPGKTGVTSTTQDIRPPGVPPTYVAATTTDGRTVWVDPNSYDKTKYRLK